LLRENRRGNYLMKRKMLMSMLAVALSASLLAGCGNTAKPADSGSVVTAGEEDGADAAQEADVAEEPGAENETEEADAGQEPEESEVPEEEPEQELVNWLEEHEIAITPQGDCAVTLYSYDSYEEDHVDDFLADVNVTITETTEGVEEGLKKVTASYVLDVSNDPGNGVMWHNSVFDRYTGNYFRGGSKTKEAIKIGDEYYDVRTEGDSVNEYPIFYITRTLICPVDYDGAVFKFGYTSPELGEQSGKIDFEARVYKVDELPYNGPNYLYFTLTDN
jgi:hypothetical protein